VSEINEVNVHCLRLQKDRAITRDDIFQITMREDMMQHSSDVYCVLRPKVPNQQTLSDYAPVLMRPLNLDTCYFTGTTRFAAGVCDESLLFVRTGLLQVVPAGWSVLRQKFLQVQLLDFRYL